MSESETTEQDPDTQEDAGESLDLEFDNVLPEANPDEPDRQEKLDAEESSHRQPISAEAGSAETSSITIETFGDWKPTEQGPETFSTFELDESGTMWEIKSSGERTNKTEEILSSGDADRIAGHQEMLAALQGSGEFEKKVLGAEIKGTPQGGQTVESKNETQFLAVYKLNPETREIGIATLELEIKKPAEELQSDGGREQLMATAEDTETREVTIDLDTVLTPTADGDSPPERIFEFAAMRNESTGEDARPDVQKNLEPMFAFVPAAAKFEKSQEANFTHSRTPLLAAREHSSFPVAGSFKGTTPRVHVNLSTETLFRRKPNTREEAPPKYDNSLPVVRDRFQQAVPVDRYVPHQAFSEPEPNEPVKIPEIQSPIRLEFFSESIGHGNEVSAGPETASIQPAVPVRVPDKTPAASMQKPAAPRLIDASAVWKSSFLPALESEVGSPPVAERRDKIEQPEQSSITGAGAETEFTEQADEARIDEIITGGVEEVRVQAESGKEVAESGIWIQPRTESVSEEPIRMELAAPDTETSPIIFKPARTETIFRHEPAKTAQSIQIEKTAAPPAEIRQPEITQSKAEVNPDKQESAGWSSIPRSLRLEERTRGEKPMPRQKTALPKAQPKMKSESRAASAVKTRQTMPRITRITPQENRSRAEFKPSQKREEAVITPARAVSASGRTTPGAVSPAYPRFSIPSEPTRFPPHFRQPVPLRHTISQPLQPLMYERQVRTSPSMTTSLGDEEYWADNNATMGYQNLKFENRSSKLEKN